MSALRPRRMGCRAALAEVQTGPPLSVPGGLRSLSRHGDGAPRGRRVDGGLPLLQVPPVSYTHLRAHETRHDLVCRLLLEKKKIDNNRKKKKNTKKKNRKKKTIT